MWPCFEWGLPCHFRYRKRGGLLLHRFTLTDWQFEHLGLRPKPQSESAVSFLLHSPRGHPHRALPGTLPYEARTFLPRANARRRLLVLLRRAGTYRAVASLSRFHAANGKSRSRNLRLARASSCRARSRDTPKRRPISASDNSSSGSAIIRVSTMYRSRGSRFCTAS